MTILSFVFLISGAAALIFEMLWFQLSGITFGNSVWASSIVLASFMGGLALGNGLAMAFGNRIRSSIRFYAFLELSIAITGFLIVLLLPRLTILLSPIFSGLIDNPFMLNAVRLVVSFLLMLIPATAMGATLPILAKALYEKDRNFGKILGTLYGWNTLGAVAGVLAAEMVLIQVFGIIGTAVVASCFNLLAALMAYGVSISFSKSSETPQPIIPAGIPAEVPIKYKPLLAASFLSGMILLALEVIWFRFILLFFTANAFNFAIMLSTVLLGISAGGLTVSVLYRRGFEVQKYLIYLLLANGITITLLYANFGSIFEATRSYPVGIRIALSSLFLMFPISFISGAIYTLLGNLIFIRLADTTKSAGVLTLTNTIGAMLGSAIAGIVLLPLLGVEKSFFTLGLFYGLAALFVAYAQNWHGQPLFRKKLFAGIAFFLLCYFIYPFGFMERHYLDLTLPEAIVAAERRVAYREGLTETIQYLQRDFLQQAAYHRLVTNNLSMSGTNLRSRRYMKFFVYLPIALNPSAKDALLICYGCGSTAKALTDTKHLKNIDFVDISKDVFDLSQIVYPDPQQNPINDPRVKIHIEDGRFYLATTKQSYDLITAEPPPPKSAGIVNLYTQEYFQLIKNHLNPGGIVTYWLPVYQLKEEETKAILKAFCAVFQNSSLWTGAELDWMMVGINNPPPKVEAVDFSLQWQDPDINREMRSLGFLDPSQMGALFLADGNDLAKWVGETPPLVDNFPKRLRSDSDRSFSLEPYYQFMSPDRCLSSFKSSNQIGAMLPSELKEAVEFHFPLRSTIDRLLAQQMPTIAELHQCLQKEMLSPLISWAYRSDQVFLDIISDTIRFDSSKFSEIMKEERETGAAAMLRHFAARATQEADYTLAERNLALATGMLAPQSQSNDFYYSFRAYLLFANGNEEQAQKVLHEYIELEPTLRSSREQYAQNVWQFLRALPSGEKKASNANFRLAP